MELVKPTIFSLSVFANAQGPSLDCPLQEADVYGSSPFKAKAYALGMLIDSLTRPARKLTKRTFPRMVP